MDFNFDVPHFSHFLGRASGLNALNFDAARVVLGHSSIKLKFHSPHGSKLQIHCRRVDWQVSSMALICSQLLPLLSHTEQLHLLSDYGGSTPQGEDNMEFTQFLELFRPFSALRSLYITKSLLPFVVPALQELAGERATDMLPNLRDLFLERSETLGYDGKPHRQFSPLSSSQVTP
ncbi:hypothetical protein BC826DRAFT_1106028 [Russula brevipes]|nr:hypothetical protein BC826DRAFT_1106028 [Russula brevipes]